MEAQCELKAAGKPYPRTCPVCRLGPCQRRESRVFANADVASEGQRNGIGEETCDAFAVWCNTDLTEGRGRQYVKHICLTLATAKRLAAKQGVQGMDADIAPVTLTKNGQYWFGPVNVVMPTEADHRTQAALDRRAAAWVKAKAAGLSDDDIKALSKACDAAAK